MVSAPVPEREDERLAELFRYNILDTPPETDFTEIVELAAYICQVPISHISLIERQRSWHKARVGLADAETPRQLTFCSHTIHGRQPLIVTDATKDVRFSNNPYVTGDPRIRFYVGFPLVTANGHSIGTLCVVDTTPRQLNKQQLKALDMLAVQVMKLLEERIRSQQFQQFALMERQRNNRLQQLIDTQRRIMSILGHDTRGPLFYINWMVQTMMKGNPDPAEVKSNYEVISNQLDSTLIMIEDLLEWSRVNILNAAGDEELFAVKDMVDELFGSLQNMAAEKSIRLLNEVPETLIGRRHERIIRFVLRNVLVNAVKFTQKGVIQVSTVASRQWLRMIVNDTGIGMSEMQVQKILSGAGSSTNGTANEKGAGLGMLLIHEFLQQINGKLEIDSAQGKGTTISITVPAV